MINIKRNPRGLSKKVLDKLELVNLLAFNLTPNYIIAKETGLSYSTINRLVPNQYKAILETRKNKVLELKEKGLNYKQIIAETGYPSATVYWLLKKVKK